MGATGLGFLDIHEKRAMSQEEMLLPYARQFKKRSLVVIEVHHRHFPPLLCWQGRSMLTLKCFHLWTGQVKTKEQDAFKLFNQRNRNNG